jgi:hypothetical protein
MTNNEKEFPILGVSRNDMEELGYDTHGTSDREMETIASRVAEAFMSSFVDEMEEAAIYLEIPKKPSI